MIMDQFEKKNVLNTIEILRYTGISLSSIYKWVHTEKNFPKSFIVGGRAHQSKKEIDNQLQEQLKKGKNNENS